MNMEQNTRHTSQDMYDIMWMIKCVIDHIQHRVHEQVNEWPVFLLLPRWLSWANPGNKGRKTNDASIAIAEKTQSCLALTHETLGQTHDTPKAQFRHQSPFK